VATSATKDKVRFGLFELDLKAGQLTKNGTRLRLPQQPLQLLSILLQRPGEILTREELRQRLWAADVFVDFDHGLNKSIQRLRDALGDSADSPRYIETIPRVGYRFIAPVQDGLRAAEQVPKGIIPGAVQIPPVVLSAPALKGVKRWWPLAVSVAILGIAVSSLVYRGSRATQPIRSLAVLPLENLSGDPGQEYFADGITDELTTMLAKGTTLRVVSRTSVMQYKGVHRPLREIARVLGVDGILEGSVSRFSGDVRMTLQLISANTDSHLWAESYERSPDEVNALTREAARDVAQRLRSSVPVAFSTRYVQSEAHDAYLRGRYLWFEGRNEEARKYFRQAVQLQPDYAPGWVGLSEYYGVVAGDTMNPLEALPQAEAYAQKAVDLNDQVPEAHHVLGAAILLNRWDGSRSLREVSRAIELDPNYADAYHFRARILAALGRNEEAIAAQKHATALDPFARPWGMTETYNWVRQYDAAIADARMRLQNTQDVLWVLTDSYRCKAWGKRLPTS
jgi:TolB-like protein/DNA-binding winged helix-turn-helix (wHTH) protein